MFIYYFFKLLLHSIYPVVKKIYSEEMYGKKTKWVSIDTGNYCGWESIWEIEQPLYTVEADEPHYLIEIINDPFISHDEVYIH